MNLVLIVLGIVGFSYVFRVIITRYYGAINESNVALQRKFGVLNFVTYLAIAVVAILNNF